MRRSYRIAISTTAVVGLLGGGGAAIAARPGAKAVPQNEAVRPSPQGRPSLTTELARLNAELAANKGNAAQLRKQIAALTIAIAQARGDTGTHQQPANVPPPVAPAGTTPTTVAAAPRPSLRHPTPTHAQPVDSSAVQPTPPGPTVTESQSPTSEPSEHDPGGGDD